MIDPASVNQTIENGMHSRYTGADGTAILDMIEAHSLLGMNPIKLDDVVDRTTVLRSKIPVAGMYDSLYIPVGDHEQPKDRYWPCMIGAMIGDEPDNSLVYAGHFGDADLPVYDIGLQKKGWPGFSAFAVGVRSWRVGTDKIGFGKGTPIALKDFETGEWHTDTVKHGKYIASHVLGRLVREPAKVTQE